MGLVKGGTKGLAKRRGPKMKKGGPGSRDNRRIVGVREAMKGMRERQKTSQIHEKPGRRRLARGFSPAGIREN
jgi:hypothetical protein